uniref:transcription factor protein isoform X1 n=1 Tax=Ciona intestinalis TaxID=7719 RepID=UPI00089DBBF4|nr:transcription factor protein isoform X1 [Ciona intestinalis]|eukprot:XP_018670755.1 transcription factor protein isoform X1 [Ciona intestinalis]
MTTVVMRTMTQDDSNPTPSYNEQHQCWNVADSQFGEVFNERPRFECFATENPHMVAGPNLQHWEGSGGSYYDQDSPGSSVEEPYESSRPSHPYYHFEPQPNYMEANGFTLLQQYVSNVSHTEQQEEPSYQTRVRTNLRKRERNLNINKAFDDLRDRIPNLPSDTKISKIKVLRLASDYIRHLSKVLVKKTPSQKEYETDNHDQFNEEISTKRKCDFEIDPDVIAVKRRKTDWSRINDEIARHQSVNQIKTNDENEHLAPYFHQADQNNLTTPPLAGELDTFFPSTEYFTNFEHRNESY